MNSVMIATARDLTPGPSGSIWLDCPWNDIKEGRNHRRGFASHIDFGGVRQSISTDFAGAEATWDAGLKRFGSTGATAVALDVDGGGLTLASDGDNEGASIADSNQMFKLAQGEKGFWFEAAIQTSIIDNTEHGFFIGLMDSTAISATVPIAADGTLADANLVGFHRLEGDGDQLDIVYRSNGNAAVNVDTDILDGTEYGGIALPTALAVDTQIKVGMKYTPNGHKRGDYCLSFFVNGVELVSVYNLIATAGNPFPNDVRMGRVFAVLNATATTPGSSSIRWWRAAQLYN